MLANIAKVNTYTHIFWKYIISKSCTITLTVVERITRKYIIKTIPTMTLRTFPPKNSDISIISFPLKFPL